MGKVSWSEEPTSFSLFVWVEPPSSAYVFLEAHSHLAGRRRAASGPLRGPSVVAAAVAVVVAADPVAVSGLAAVVAAVVVAAAGSAYLDCRPSCLSSSAQPRDCSA